jgi:hypothetical protein
MQNDMNHPLVKQGRSSALAAVYCAVVLGAIYLFFFKAPHIPVALPLRYDSVGSASFVESNGLTQSNVYDGIQLVDDHIRCLKRAVNGCQDDLQCRVMDQVKNSLSQTTQDAERLWQAVVKQSVDEDYLKKYENISLQLERNSEPRWKWKWKNKAYPRIPCLLDFEAWVSKYSLQSPEHLLTNAPNDPELEFLSPKKVTQFVHAESEFNNGDLHFIPCDMNPARDFDLVVISQTLEHLYDPFLALANVFHFMRSGGYIFTSAPANNIPHMTPVHYFHYTPMGLAVLFQRAGFEVLEVGAWGSPKYEEGMLIKHTWLDFSDLQNEDGLIINQANTNPDDVWLLARKPGSL